jgi:NMD protein affecting ribosome stability and mRNA decay
MYKGVFGRKDRLVRERRHDVYRIDKKLREPSRCQGCGVVFTEGRWSWAKAPENASLTTCPACQRIADNVPAGILSLSGSFLHQHREELIGLIANVEALEKGERPLERIMSVDDTEGGLEVKTTGVHVARRIGDALGRSYQGDLAFTYGNGEKSIQVSWRRDATEEEKKR